MHLFSDTLFVSLNDVNTSLLAWKVLESRKYMYWLISYYVYIHDLFRAAGHHLQIQDKEDVAKAFVSANVTD